MLNNYKHKNLKSYIRYNSTSEISLSNTLKPSELLSSWMYNCKIISMLNAHSS